MFAPGYGGNRRGTDRAPGSGSGGPDSSRWYGSTAGGAAGKGPVRGYPPVPGQPPPMYPPGPFAAWNRGRHGQAGPVAPPGQPDGAQPDRSQPDTGQPGSGRADSGQWRSASGQPSRDGRQPAAWQSPTAAGATAGTSRYYERSDGPEAEPGYSMLAVSDPAADVTSTQTWQALGDGRSTGIWAAPARPGTGPSRPAAPPTRRSPDVAGPDAVPGGRDAGLSGPEAETGAAGTEVGGLASRTGVQRRPESVSTGAASAGTTRTDITRTGNTRTDGTRTRARSHSGARTGRQDTAPRSQRAASRKSRGKHPANVRLAVTVAILFVLAAAATLAYGVLRPQAKPRPAAGPTQAPKVTPSAAASPTPGPYGHIGSRSSDPRPLTVAQLFPSSFTVAGQVITRTATGAGQRCVAALDGANIRSAVRRAHCDQVVRATYLSKSGGLMGTIGVLNLSTASGAVKAIRSADASDFIGQLKARHGPTHRIGGGTGIEVAAAKGHYLILIWAEFTSLRKPKTTAQRRAIENFMTQLLDRTANVSLSARMLTGTP